jgi:uncharacterized membrane protein YdjX (TVP38/TMEM64 family)
MRRNTKLRLLALVALTLGLLALARFTGLTDELTTERLRASLESAGTLGMLLFIAVFTLGELVHIPGWVFCFAAILAYGRVLGGGLSFLGAVVSVVVSFVIVRTIGGRALEEIERPFMKKLLRRLDKHPLQTVFVLRTLFWMAPPLNYALALTNVRFRAYVLGSALGLVLPMVGLSVFFDFFISRFGL